MALTPGLPWRPADRSNLLSMAKDSLEQCQGLGPSRMSVSFDEEHVDSIHGRNTDTATPDGIARLR